MTALAWRAAPYAAVLLAALSLWLYVTHLQRSRDSALAGQAATMQALSVETAARQAVTDALVRSEAALAAREGVRQTQATQLRREQGELNATLSQAPDWAAGRVPPDVLGRLRAAAAADDGRDAPTAGQPAH